MCPCVILAVSGVKQTPDWKIWMCCKFRHVFVCEAHVYFICQKQFCILQIARWYADDSSVFNMQIIFFWHAWDYRCVYNKYCSLQFAIIPWILLCKCLVPKANLKWVVVVGRTVRPRCLVGVDRGWLGVAGVLESVAGGGIVGGSVAWGLLVVGPDCAGCWEVSLEKGLTVGCGLTKT